MPQAVAPGKEEDRLYSFLNQLEIAFLLLMIEQAIAMIRFSIGRCFGNGWNYGLNQRVKK
jgi:hypothetical protein